MQDKAQVKKKTKSGYEDETEMLREVPELTEKIKAMLRVQREGALAKGKKKTLVIKGHNY